MNRTGSQAAIPRPDPREADDFGQVVPFRRPGRTPLLRPASSAGADVDHLARFEQNREEPEPEEFIDYRQRMFMNVVALVVVTLLVTAGVWLADTIAGMERDQDCVMQGRANCAPIELPLPAQP
jgi:hypothetical protein